MLAIVIENLFDAESHIIRHRRDTSEDYAAVIYLLKVNSRSTKKNVWNLFRANNNKDSRWTSVTSFRSLYCQLWAYFAHCLGVSIVNYKQVHLAL